MFIPAYLQQSRHGVWYLRWPIPRALHPARKQSSVRVSLQTHDPKKALRLSRSISHMADMVIEGGTKRGMRYDEIRALLKDHFQQLLDRRKERIGQTGRLSKLDRQAYENGMWVASEAADGDDTLWSPDGQGRELLSSFIEKYDLDMQEGTKPYSWLQQELKVSYRAYAKAVLEYDASLADYDLAARPAASPAAEVPAQPEGMSLSELAVSYAQEKKRGRLWAAKTELEKTDHIELLKEVVGAGADVARLTPKDAKRVKDTLLGYPKNRSKNRLTRGKPLVDVLDLPNVDKLEPATINKYLQTYNDLFEWARRNSHVAVNHFSGLTIRQNKQRVTGKRKPFTNAQVVTILDTITSNRDGLVRKDYQKWGPLIGIYTGARLNEIAQIHLADIRQQDGIWCFDLNDEGDDKHLKTENARRLVPIHAKLIEHGLLDHVDEKKARGERKLFPDFRHDPKNGWGRHLGRWFNDTLLPKLELKQKELVFHSLRHTVITRLMQAGVQEPVVKALVGHAQQGVTQQHYFNEGYTLKQLDEALQKLNYNPPPPETAN